MRFLMLPVLVLVLCAACGPVSYPPNEAAFRDAELAARIKTALLNSPEIDGTRIEVHTADGAVTLAGTVPTGDDVQQAVDLVRGLAGVVDVESKLSVKEKPVATLPLLRPPTARF